MEFSNLSKDPKYKVAEVSTGNSEVVINTPPPPDPNRPPYTPPYRNKVEADPTIIDEVQYYPPQGKQHAEKFGVRITPNLKMALEARAKGEFCLSPREADVAARMRIPLEGSFFKKALICFGNMITEGSMPGEPDNVYHLRAYYNRGVKFKKPGPGNTPSDYTQSSPARQEQADSKMKDILEKLEAMQIPAWPQEIQNGFATELCKPEYMTWQQYEAAANIPLQRSPAA